MAILVWSSLPELCGTFVTNSLLQGDFLECKKLTINYLYVSSLSGFENRNTPSRETQCHFVVYHGYLVTGFN